MNCDTAVLRRFDLMQRSCFVYGIILFANILNFTKKCNIYFSFFKCDALGKESAIYSISHSYSALRG